MPILTTFRGIHSTKLGKLRTCSKQDDAVPMLRQVWAPRQGPKNTCYLQLSKFKKSNCYTILSPVTSSGVSFWQCHLCLVTLFLILLSCLGWARYLAGRKGLFGDCGLPLSGSHRVGPGQCGSSILSRPDLPQAVSVGDNVLKCKTRMTKCGGIRYSQQQRHTSHRLLSSIMCPWRCIWKSNVHKWNNRLTWYQGGIQFPES